MGIPPSRRARSPCGRPREAAFNGARGGLGGTGALGSPAHHLGRAPVVGGARRGPDPPLVSDGRGSHLTPPSTIAVDTGHAWVLIDYRTGRTELHATLPDNRSLRPTIRLKKQVHSWGTGETAAVLPRSHRRRLLWRLLCLPAVVMVAMVLFLGPRNGRLGRLVTLACLGRRLPPAPTGHVRAALDSIRYVSTCLPGRWACLEQSVATAFLITLTGRRAEWRHGLATDPVRLHAWLADGEGRPVGEGPDIGAYTPIHTTDGPGPPPRPDLENES